MFNPYGFYSKNAALASDRNVVAEADDPGPNLDGDIMALQAKLVPGKRIIEGSA